MKRLLISLLCLVMCLLVFTSCVKGSENTENGTEVEEIVEPTPTPYYPNLLTGEERDNDYNEYSRPVAIMVNNIAACRPQRGLSDADILVESKVEGGITRFMAVYQDYTKVDGDIGPVRSGRDQFLRLAMPLDALYLHIGRSGITQTYIDSFEYNDSDVDGRKKVFTHRDQRRLNQGYALEHTAFTTPEELTNAFEKYEYVTEKFNHGTWLDYVPYYENDGMRDMEGESATSVGITHSQSYRTYFDFDEETGKYMMSQYNSRKGYIEDTVDENNGVHLSFQNLVVLFADIHAYPYPGGNLDANGNDKGNPDYQCVEMEFGGVGYYFSNGRVEKIRWFKGAAPDILRLTDWDENGLKVNVGNTYLTFVDLDEFYNFEYAGEEEEIDTEVVVDGDGAEEEIGEDVAD